MLRHFALLITRAPDMLGTRKKASMQANGMCFAIKINGSCYKVIAVNFKFKLRAALAVTQSVLDRVWLPTMAAQSGQLQP